MTGPGRAEVGAACHGALESAADRLVETLGEPLRDAARKARGAHRSAREAAGLHREEVPEEDVRERLLEYLEAVRARVHTPFLTALDEARPVAACATLLDEALAASSAAVAELPEWRTASELTGDEPSRGTGTLARLATGLAGPGDERRVRSRWVAGRHVSLRLARGVDRWTGLVAREWATWLAALEVAWARWAGVVLHTIPAPGGADGDARAWSAFHAAGAALETALGELADMSPVEPLRSEMDSDLERWNRSLAGDLEVGGTFLLRTEGPLPTPPRARTDVAAWTRWEEEVLARGELHAALLEAVGSLHSLARRVPARLRADLGARWRDEGGRLAESLEGEAETLRGLGPDGSESSPMDAERLQEARSRVEALLESLTGHVPRPEAFEEAAEKAGDATVAALQGLLRGLPERLVLHPPVDADQLPRGPVAQGRALRLREVARASFDALRVERLRTIPRSVVPRAAGVAAAKEQVSEVVRFGFDAAREELDRNEAGSRERAAELAAEALGRSAEAVRAAPEPLDRSVAEVATALTAELHQGLVALLERALADRLQGRVLEARSRLAASWGRLAAGTSARMERVLRSGKLQAARIRRHAGRLARRGRRIVSAPSEGVQVGTGRLLAHEAEVREGLPLVYQRLFAAEPLEDETLLAGRSAALGEAEARWLRWRESDGVPLLVTGRPGVGVSSFVRVFLERVRSRGARVVHHVVEVRLDSEAALSERLADLMGLPPSATLDELAGAVLSAPRGTLPDLVALEGLEHLYLRVPGGTDVLERLLTFMAETEPRTFWMGTLTSSAWQILEVAEPTAVSQVERMDLPGLDAEALRQAVLLRHRRSGVPLRWEEPAGGRRLFRRRLARARGHEGRERLLEQDFFARLHRATGGNVRLALFQWLRAADFAAQEGALTVRPRSDLDLTFLDALPPTQHFTLKAFLEHGTLTLDEHDRVFRLPRQESYQIFEALGNRHVIQPVPGSGAEAVVSEAADSVRYRINPLLLGGVTATLGGRNILH